ncbi:hypothetical protein Taro_017673 [Colocasia esculenta]|uniref:Uncharacterized protein n=1 Tax=Colocasia esculenta TaxID=4460 RepID=A0A843UTY1_COLES|nr:hypothetical protein [Colocasia esculenta]
MARSIGYKYTPSFFVPIFLTPSLLCCCCDSRDFSVATCRQPTQSCRQAHVFQNSRILDCVDLSTDPLVRTPVVDTGSQLVLFQCLTLEGPGQGLQRCQAWACDRVVRRW